MSDVGAVPLDSHTKARFPLPELAVNTARVDGNGNRSPVNSGRQLG